MSKPNKNGQRSLINGLLAALKLGLIGLILAVPLMINQGSVEGAPSTQLNFQARLLGSSGAIVADGNYHVEFKLYNAASGGSALWTETRTTGNLVSVKSGYLSVQLGSVNAFPSSINWNEEHWLTMNIGGSSGSATWDGEMTPRIKLTAVPFAFQAEQLAKTSGANRGTLGFNTVTNNPNIVLPDASGTVCLQNATACGFAAGSGDADYIQNGMAQQANANFNILAGSGVAATIEGASGQNILVVNQSGGAAAFTIGSTGNATLAGTLAVNGGNITSTGALDVASGGSGNLTLTTGGSVRVTVDGTSGDVTFGGNVVLAATKTLRLTGGTTAGRPVSPGEGTIYYDTDTDQLLVYSAAASKWQGDRSAVSKIVAANDSSQAAKDAADYVADGTGDQTEINTALTAAAGGKVYLMEGTYNVSAVVSVPNNTTLSGAGPGTVIKLVTNSAANAITNSDTTTGTGVVVRDLRLDGNKGANTNSEQYGVVFNGMGDGAGSSARQGGQILNIWVASFHRDGIELTGSDNNTISGNAAQDNQDGFYITGSNYNKISNNLSQGNGNRGFLNEASDYNVFTGNTAQGNTGQGVIVTSTSDDVTLTGNVSQGNANNGFEFNGASSNLVGATFSGNTAQGNTGFGLYIFNTGSGGHINATGNLIRGSSTGGVALITTNRNTVANNRIYDNGGAAHNDGVYLGTADSNTVSGNDIYDSSCTTTCLAIEIDGAANDTNYLADNTLGNGSIGDTGTGTIYGGQLSSVGDFTLDPSGDINLTSDTNVTGVLSVSALGATNTDTVLCRNNINELAACNSTFAAQSYVTLQNAYANGNTMLATDAEGDIDFTISEATNFSVDMTGTGSFLIQDGGVAVATVSSTNGSVLFRPSTDSAAAFDVQSRASGSSLLKVDSLNGRVGIGLGSQALDMGTGSQGLLVYGGLSIGNVPDVNGSITGEHNFVTPHSTSIGTLFSIPNVKLNNLESAVALSIKDTSATGAAGITVFDDRANAGGLDLRPAISLFSEDESKILGLSWEGVNTTGYLKASSGNVGIRIGTTNAATFSTTAISLLQNTVVTGNFETSGTIDIGTLGSTDSVSYLCRNAAGIIASCNTTGTGAMFVQGGNDFGATAAVLGTTNNQNLTLITNNVTRLTIDTSGNATLTGNLTVQGTGASSIAGNLTVDTNTLHIDAANNRVGIGTTTPNARMQILGSAAQAGTGTLTTTLTPTTNTTNTAVVGTGTAFLTELAVGDTITAAGQTRTVTAITDNTNLTVNNGFNPVLTGAAFTYKKPNIRLNDSSGNIPLGLTNTGVDGNFDINGMIGVGNNASAGGVAVMNFDHVFNSDVSCAFGCYGTLFNVRANNPGTFFGAAGTVGLHATSGTSAGNFTLSSTIGMSVGSAVLGAGSTITSNTGIQIGNQTAGVSDYGLVIQGADTAALKIYRGETAADVLTVESVNLGNIGNNSGAEDNDPTTDFTNAWTAFGTSTITRDTDAADIVSGVASVSAVFGTTDENGVRNNLASNPALSTTYVVSFVARLSAGTAFTDMAVRYTPNGGTNNVDCTNYTTQTLTSSFVKVTCTILTDNTAVSNPDLIIRQPTAPGSGRTVHIDNFSMTPQTSSSTAATLRIGSAVGQGLQLLTLDHAAARPWTGSSNALYGSMYYDTSLGKIQCYEADGWGACGGAPDNIVNLVPEYAGSVLNGTGIGTMTADLCSDALNINDSGGSAVCGAGQAYNFYKWTSPQASAQTYSIYISYQLPATFNGFADANTIKLTGRTSSTSGGNGITFALYQANGTQCGSTTTVNSTTNTWETTNLTGDETACSFAANDVITFRINMTSTGGSSAYSSNFSFTTLGK